MKKELTATKQAYIDAFIKIAKEKPLNKITVRELITLTNTSRATFYRHFCDIYEVLEYIEDFIYHQISDQIINKICMNDLDQTFSHNINVLYQNCYPYLKIVFKEGNPPHFQNKVKAKGKATIIKNMNLSPDNMQIDYILDYYMSSILALVARRINHPHELSDKEFENLLKGILTDGVISQLNKHND